MKKVLFALSILVVSPMANASEGSTVEQEETILQAKSDNAASVVEAVAQSVLAQVVEAASVTPTPVTEVVSTPASVATEAVAVAKNVLEKGYGNAVNGVTSVKNSTINGVAFIKDGVFCAYNKVTEEVEALTPSMILNVRDAIRGTIANYPLTAVALTAFITVKVSNYFSASSEVAEDEEDFF